MKRAVYTIGPGLAAMLLASQTWAAEVETLHHDPFRHPLLHRTISAAKKSKNPHVAGRKLQLRATLVADKQSLANINGKIVSLGNRIEGFRLVKIQQGKVMLLKNGRQLTLTIKK